MHELQFIIVYVESSLKKSANYIKEKRGKKNRVDPIFCKTGSKIRQYQQTLFLPRFSQVRL